MINTIYCDLDGVLVNFRKGIHKAFNQPYEYSTLSDKWYFWKDWPGITFDMVNAACDLDFWRHLEWTEDGLNIYEAIRNKFKPEQIYLLTTPMPNIFSPTGKWMWVKNNIPEFYKRTIITQAPKSLFARPDTLLIDDKDQNVDEFVKAGGQGILVPRSWNELHSWANESLQVVKNSLESF